jgi:hypothetical protein
MPCASTTSARTPPAAEPPSARPSMLRRSTWSPPSCGRPRPPATRPPAWTRTWRPSACLPCPRVWAPASSLASPRPGRPKPSSTITWTGCSPHPGQRYAERHGSTSHWSPGSAEQCPAPKMPPSRPAARDDDVLRCAHRVSVARGQAVRPRHVRRGGVAGGNPRLAVEALDLVEDPREVQCAKGPAADVRVHGDVDVQVTL